VEMRLFIVSYPVLKEDEYHESEILNYPEEGFGNA
jgi:hypothetical protein